MRSPVTKGQAMPYSSSSPVDDDYERSGPGSSKLSYKFQRLRERIRAAIASGELSGKLPGERQLARRFHVNAKTLSKALTDLAAEGVLDRSIGRGTYVKGAAPASSSGANSRWLVLCDEDQAHSGVIDQIRKAHPSIQIMTDTSSLRPSVLNSLRAVIDMATNTPDTLIRDLIVRNIHVVLVGKEPITYSVDAVLVDRALGASILAREMLAAGHRHFLAVERRGQTAVAEAIRRTAQRFGAEGSVDSVYPADVVGAVEQLNATAVICDTRKAAVQVRESLERRGIAIPQRVSLGAIGSGWGEFPCSGYFLHADQKASTIIQMLLEQSPKRPSTLWLTGAYHDAGTIAAAQGLAIGAMQRDQDVLHRPAVGASVRM